jgi:penicillin amidase
MHKPPVAVLLTALLTTGSGGPLVTSQDTLRLPGLEQPVEIITDRWGIAHIYAETEEDLFFAQGFNAARDRLFQLEIWRRQAHGTVAEILGPRETRRDVGTRLFQFRGDMERELKHYHPRGDRIIPAFVRGVNAYIELTERDPDLLPIEFELLGIAPGRWTPATVISRHQGLLGNITQELNHGRAVSRLGAATVLSLSTFGPGEPDLTLDEAIDGSLLFDDILDVYSAFRRPIRFQPEDIVPAHRSTESAERLNDAAGLLEFTASTEDIGSNNWVVSGALTQSGYPIMANDPHRAQSAPSLRYWVHLVGPGWNVIGGGEPEVPGVSIGHNEHGAWGLTVFSTDGEDLYVYDTNPANPMEYRYDGHWERMTVITDTIRVKGASPVVVRHKYTRHGPVVYEDAEHQTAYAVRAAWMEVGGAPYLASLRMDQARTWEEFRDACSYSHIPGENMIWADRRGTIGWQAVGIAPIRPNWSGLVPIPGDGRYEWDGYLPIIEKPNTTNPPAGYFGTANNNLIPPGYPHRNAVGWTWSDPARWARLNEVLGSGRKHSMMDMMRLQTDYLSIPARTLVPLLADLPDATPSVERMRQRLLDWDLVLDKNSATASVYTAWERSLRRNVQALFVPENGRGLVRVSMSKTVDWLLAPPGQFGADPVAGRDSVLLSSLAEALQELEQRLGPDPAAWQYGQERNKHALIRHPLSRAVDDAMRRRLDVGPAPRGGNGSTVNNTGGGNNQTSGASFRIIVDTKDWDTAVGSNTPGQAGDPDSPHYRDLFEMWANDRYFPVFFTRERVEGVAGRTLQLVPRYGWKAWRAGRCSWCRDSSSSSSKYLMRCHGPSDAALP